MVDCEEEVLIVSRARDYLVQNETVTVDESDQDITGDGLEEDLSNIRIFLLCGCGCQLKCHELFDYETVANNVLDIRALTKDEKELNIMSLLKDCEGETTKRGKKRKRSRNEYRIEGKTVCKKTFMLFFDIGKHQLLSLQQHVRVNGLTPRVHGNRGRKPGHAICYDDVMRVVFFIRNYADERGLPQPAAPRGIDNIPTVYLTADTTKATLHKQYQSSCNEAGARVLQITAFKEIWNTCLPHIRMLVHMMMFVPRAKR